jgi:hypothetical protein
MSEQNPVVRNIGNTSSRTLAIHAMCAHCMGCTREHVEQGWRNEVDHCSAQHCPLFEFRPRRVIAGQKTACKAPK